MAEKRYGQQTPTISIIEEYKDTRGQEAIDLYNESGEKVIEWQEIQIMDILALDDDGLFAHQKYGYSVPRRNGKGEILIIRELWGIVYNHEKILHTAHRTNTSTAAAFRLAKKLKDIGWVEVQRPKVDEVYENGFSFSKQKGLESIKLLDGSDAVVNFRTRSNAGGLGEGYDVLIIDEAQEYTNDQESTLKYTVSASGNPQTLLCGTPPTNISVGTVFKDFRNDILSKMTPGYGWAEWSIETYTKEIENEDVWYMTNPSLGYHLTVRNVRMELSSDETKILDFNIQRLGLWYVANQNSVISEGEWNAIKVDKPPEITGKLCAGIKFGRDGVNVALSIAAHTTDGSIFFEGIGCRPIRSGSTWIVEFLKNADVVAVTVDGINGQTMLLNAIEESGIKAQKIFPEVKEVVDAHTMFEVGLEDKTIKHNGQKALTYVATNCDHRNIGTGGGRGFKSIKEDADISLLESAILAIWTRATVKDQKRRQRVIF